MSKPLKFAKLLCENCGLECGSLDQINSMLYCQECAKMLIRAASVEEMDTE